MLSTLQPNEHLISETTSLCKICKNGVPAITFATPNQEVWMRKLCQTHGIQEIQISNNANWYETVRNTIPTLRPPSLVKKEIHYGCPFDCGPCENHQQKIRLPVVTITSACNLDCPICYVHNKNKNSFHMTIENFQKILDHLVQDHGGELDIINFTGGEPTVHPHFLDFLKMSQAAGIHRVTICSNGIRLANDESLVQKLAELHARVALSFDTFDPEVDIKMQGKPLLETKLRCLDLLEKHQVDTTLIPVMTKGLNETEIGQIIDLALKKTNVRHIEIHTMTFTGQGGSTFNRSGRISTHEVLEQIEQTTHGILTKEDFVSSPCAHPLCYQIAYLLLDPQGGPPISFARFLGREALYESLTERLYLEPSPRLEQAIKEAIDRLWVEEDDESERILKILRNLLENLFPQNRPLSLKESLKVGETFAKAIYIHSHMDEETFDTERIAQCCDSNCYADGTTIPVCSYNVLYREKEAHFNTAPLAWNERTGGRK